MSRLLWLAIPGLLLTEARSIPRYASKVSRGTANLTSYDFVIAGGGITGLVLADRLTEDPSVTVLVIEAGPLDQGQDDLYIPGAWSPFPYVWFATTEPLTALNNRVESVVCGKIAGGGSTINAMNFMRGVAADYDGWAALGNPGWGWDEILPYFIKARNPPKIYSENFTAPDPEFAKTGNISWDDSVRGLGGPVQYTYANYYYPDASNWWDATLSVGLEPALDPQRGTNTGIFWLPSVRNETTQRRCDARNAHYDRVIDTRPNYHVLMDTTVSRILFDGTRASGVEYLPSGGGDVLSTVSASKEVIVASGALHTPGLLQRSGIGAKAVLEPLGIQVISDLPGVGSNFQDQTTVHVPLNLTKNLSPNANSINVDAEYNATQWAAYQAHLPSAYTLAHNLSTTFTGVTLEDIVPASTSNTNETNAIIAAAAAYDAADSLPSGADATVLAGYKAQRSVLLSQMQNQTLSVGFLYFDTFSSAEAYLMKPFSRGSVRINSTDPLAQPVIDYGTATDPADLALNAALLGKLRQVVAAPAMQALGPVAGAPFGDDVVTEEDIEAALRESLIISNAHQCCTAPMMPLGLGGVVGPDKKVYGVTGLRVGDISTFPTAVSGGPTATVYGAAEKLADIIKKEWSAMGYYS